MSRMLCKCGATMGTTASPSPYSLCVFYEQEVESAVAENPKLLLSDFLTDWDEVNQEQTKYMKRSESVEYWICTVCKRVYETQIPIGGRWLRVYQRAEQLPPIISYEGWRRLYVFEDVETDTILEGSPQLLLSDYLEMHKGIHYLLSPDECTVVAVSVDDQQMLFAYIQEEISAAE